MLLQSHTRSSDGGLHSGMNLHVFFNVTTVFFFLSFNMVQAMHTEMNPSLFKGAAAPLLFPPSLKL